MKRERERDELCSGVPGMSWNKYVVSENVPETEATPLTTLGPEEKQAVGSQVNKTYSVLTSTAYFCRVILR